MSKHFTSKKAVFRLALAGNPNSGKSSVFNRLTGLSQKIGNFPGVTVDKKSGHHTLPDKSNIEIIDLPGAYSFYPTSLDERIVVQNLADPHSNEHPDAVLFIADITRLEHHLLLFTQIKDLGLPIALVLNMADMAEKQGRKVDVEKLSQKLNVPVVLVSSHTGMGYEALEPVISSLAKQTKASINFTPFYTLSETEQNISQALKDIFPTINGYQRVLLAHHYKWMPSLSATEKEKIQEVVTKEGFTSLHYQVEETMSRFNGFEPIVHQVVSKTATAKQSRTSKIDSVLTHPIMGPFIFLGLMAFIFQAIFTWANYPMDLIEALFGYMDQGAKAILPDFWLTDLLTDGVLAGLGGILIFIPQIAILFLLITILEEVGYMARAAFLFDHLMRYFGLNGRSLVSLISGGACAIPAVMSARTISNWKERMITIFVTPFISCTARIPVYVVLIGFVVPTSDVRYLGFFTAQSLAFMGLYVLGIMAALFTALAFKYLLKSEERSYLMLALPEYRMPLVRNVGFTVWGKVRSFVVEAGKVIMIISVILWALGSYGPGEQMAFAENEAKTLALANELSNEKTNHLIANYRLEASYAGYMGKFIEPAIKPLGFDWKMGIAIISSFAAREVFTGTMATLYSIADDSKETKIHNRMAQEVDPLTGKKVYTRATSMSLLIFYVFAMMCMATLAVVKRETNSWKWPIFQFLFMTGLAYLASWAVFNWMS